MLSDISHVSCKLFGFNCLRESEKQHMMRCWEERFSPKTAFMVDVVPEDSELTLIGKVQSSLLAQDIASLENENCIITVFLDLTEPCNEEFISMLDKAGRRLMAAFHCQVVMALQYGYTGQIALADGDQIRNNIKMVSQYNSQLRMRTQLMLIASSALATDLGACWRPGFVALDIFRRLDNPLGVLPVTKDGATNNDVGFFSYKEHNQRVQEELLSKQQTVLQRLNADNSDVFARAFRKEVEERERVLKDQCAIDGSLQPQHPGMIVPEGGLFGGNRKKAQRGNYEPYNIAKNATITAIKMTGDAIGKTVAAQYEASEEEADALFARMVEEATLGLGVLKNKQKMHELLTIDDIDGGNMQLPALYLNYSPEGCKEEISQYLDKVWHNARSKGRKALSTALKDAYDRIPTSRYVDEEEELRKEELKLQSVLRDALTARAFCEKAIHTSMALHGEFTSANPNGVSRRYLLCRGAEMKQLIEETGDSVSGTYTYYINQEYGGIVQLDGAPIKLVSMTLLDCNDETLKDLIPEV